MVQKLTFYGFLMSALVLIPTYGAGILEFSHYQRLNDEQDNLSDFTNFVELSTRREEKEGTGFSYQYDFGVRKYNNSADPLISLSEGYVSYRTETSALSLGRKKLGWNPGATHWNLGELYSTRGFNLATDQEEGTVGLHLKKRWGKFFVQGVVSNVFVPQLNPGVEILDGTIEANSEWSNLPPSRVRFQEQDIPIVYNVEMPAVADFIRQNTYALALGFRGDKNEIIVHAGRKPEPGPRINAAGFLENGEDGRVIVNAKPFVNLQNFYGASWQRQWGKRFSTAIDYQYIAPERGQDDSFTFEGFSIEPRYTNISYGTFYSQWRGDFLRLRLMALRAFKTYETTDATFEKRLRFEKAVGLDISWQARERLELGGHIKRDLERDDIVMTSFARVQLFRKVLGTIQYQSVDAPNDRSFWSAYRSNDLWQVNLRYLF